MLHQKTKSTPVDYSKIPDEELVQKIVAHGTVELYGILYDRYSQKVFNKCLTFVKSQSTAEDLTHDIFIKAFVNLSKFRYQSKFSTWFYALAYNMCVDYTRKQVSNKKINFIEFDKIERERVKIIHCDSEEQLLSFDVEELKIVLEKLPPEDRVILLMKYQDELSIKEIKEQLQVSESAVKMRLLRARERAVAVYHNLFQTYKPDDQY